MFVNTLIYPKCNFQFFCGRITFCFRFRYYIFFLGFRHYAADLFAQVPQKCTTLDLGLLYILVFGTYNNFERKTNFLALGIYLVQPCSSAVQA